MRSRPMLLLHRKQQVDIYNFWFPYIQYLLIPLPEYVGSINKGAFVVIR